MLSDRLPPQHLEAERGVLGSILLDNEVLHDIVVLLPRRGFLSRRPSGHLCGDPRALRQDQGHRRGHSCRGAEAPRAVRQVGGDDTLTEIVTSVPHAANGKYYAEIVKEKATSRQLIESATEIIRDGYSNQFTAQELLEASRAQDLRHRRGPDPGRDARAQGRGQAGDGSDRRPGRFRRPRRHGPGDRD